VRLREASTIVAWWPIAAPRPSPARPRSKTDIRDFATPRRCCGDVGKVSSRLKTGDLSGLTITLKLKTADFRSDPLAIDHAPTQLAAKIFRSPRDAGEGDRWPAFPLMGTGVNARRRTPTDTDMLDPARRMRTRNRRPSARNSAKPL